MNAMKKKKVSPKKLSADKPATKKLSAKPKYRNNVSILNLPRPNLVSQLAAGSSDAQKISPRVQAMVDKSEIVDLLTTFARGLDRIDENLLRSVLHPDATLDLGPGIFQGTGNDYVTWVMGVLQGVKSSHHLIANVGVELEGDTALVESYFHVHVRLDKSIGREDVFMGGRNLDRMERRPAGPAGVWKVVHRKQMLDWVRTEVVSDIFYHQNPDALWSARSKLDPSYQMSNFPGSQTGGKLPAFLGRRYESKSVRF